MVKIKCIRVSYKKELVLEMKLQHDGSWSMVKGPASRRDYKKPKKPKKKASSHFKKLKNAYGRYLNR